MGITYNRRPVGVSVPSSNDSKHHFFNHYNWKGINQNRNFLTVDQETFADSNNVYVDDEGLLKSRPPLRHVRGTSEKKIKEIKSFGNIIICTYIDNYGDWFIGIIKDDVLVFNYETISYYPLRVFRNGDYLYIFVSNGVLKYNVDENTIDENSMYIPVTRIYTGSTFEYYDEENLFSTYEKYRYLISSTSTSTAENIIDVSAQGKYGEYEYYIGTDKISKKIYIDSEGKFLNHLHQPFSGDVTGYEVVNYYGDTVPSSLIQNDMLYRYFDGKLLRASISDMLFEVLIDNIRLNIPSESFVKITQTDGYIIIIGHRNCVVYNPIDDSLETLRTESDFLVDVAFVNFRNYVEVGFVIEVEYTYLEMIIHNDDIDYVPKTIQLEPINDNPNFEDYVKSSKVQTNSNIGEYGDIGFVITFRYGNNAVESFFNDYVLLESNMTPVSKYGTYATINDNLIVYDVNENPLKIVDNVSIFPNVFFKYYSKNSYDFHYALLGSNEQVGYNLEYGTIGKNNTSDKMNVGTGSKVYYNHHGLYISNDYLSLNSSVLIDFPGHFVPTNSDFWFYASENKGVTLSNYLRQPQKIDVIFEKSSNYRIPTLLYKGEKIFLSYDSELYIGELVIDETESIWFKKSYRHIMDNTITGFHQISDEAVAIFTAFDTWYSVLSDGVYYYQKSKIVPVLKNNSRLLTLQDSTTTLMPSHNGIVALSYQNFVSNSEQSTANITQNISNLYNIFEFNIDSVNWKNYILFYESNKRLILIFDVRNQSWWRWTLPTPINQLFVIDGKLYVLSDGDFYTLYDDTTPYFDLVDGIDKHIDWYIESQKLHLNANNHYKHIVNLTLASVDNGDLPIHLNLNVKNYRKYVDNGKAENFDYDIDVIRTYVKRLNYAKVCEFQYRLSSDDEAVINVPLALSNITVKYKIGGQVR